MIRTFLRSAVAALLVALGAALASPALAIDIVEIDGPETGVPGLLVEDRANPIVTLRIAFDGGSLIERTGEEGLVNLLSTMLDEGAGDLDSETFQERLDALGVRFSADAQRESFRLGVSALEGRFDEAIELLALAMNEPRFDAEPLARMKRQLASSLDARNGTPRARTQREVAALVWGDHPYARSADGDAEVVRSADPDALRAIRERLFARDNATVAMVGAITPEEAAAAIDRLFAGLPESSGVEPVPPAAPRLGLDETFEVPGQQASLQVVLPAPKREDEDFFAAFLVNHVLGGGTFTSRLYDELREKRGLTYGAGSGIATREAGATWNASVSTRPENAEEARRILVAEIERMAREGPTEEELEAAKAFVKGTYAINNLSSSASVAGVLLGIQRADLGTDYIDRREALIDAVTIEDARRVAAEYLAAEPTIITVMPETAG